LTTVPEPTVAARASPAEDGEDEIGSPVVLAGVGVALVAAGLAAAAIHLKRRRRPENALR